MPVSGYIKIEDIKGESKRADHEDEIDFHSLAWHVQQQSSANVGSGRSRGRAQISDITVRQFTDAASPYLALAVMQAKSIPEIVLMTRKDSGDAHLDYLKITLSNAAVSGFRMLETEAADPEQMIEEEVSFTAEKVNIVYTVQADDHSAGDEHEVEYDIVAGK
jgi:type VI secretion system secreted protein Hcp